VGAVLCAPAAPKRLQLATASTKAPSSASSSRSPACASTVAPISMPPSIHGSRRASSRHSMSRRLRKPRNDAALRSSSSIIGTAKRSGTQCASKGNATTLAPKPPKPKSV